VCTCFFILLLSSKPAPANSSHTTSSDDHVRPIAATFGQPGVAYLVCSVAPKSVPWSPSATRMPARRPFPSASQLCWVSLTGTLAAAQPQWSSIDDADPNPPVAGPTPSAAISSVLREWCWRAVIWVLIAVADARGTALRAAVNVVQPASSFLIRRRPPHSTQLPIALVRPCTSPRPPQRMPSCRLMALCRRRHGRRGIYSLAGHP